MQAYEEDLSGFGTEHASDHSADDLAPPMGDDFSSNENFKVAIRVRPPVPRELEGPRQFINVVRIPADHKSITLCEHLDIDDGRGGVYSTQTFTFDYVYDHAAKQQHVYERSAMSAVSSVLHGYNATLIAYGQTGTGKTFTMEGFTNNESRGIIPRATEEIFSYIQSCRNKDMKFLVRASYLQIYNEVISDLLKPLNRQLTVRHTKQRGVYIEGLSEWVVRSPNDVYGLMERGCSLRATGATRMSELSSRSHAMFIIIVEVMEGDENNPQSYKYGKLNIVDLAGSEKVRQTGVTGQRLEETKKINWSLHELGNVIAALTDMKRKDKHIPFRNSCLTRVLQDSLGGNCKTTLIACISPALESYSESLSTLKFANRAKNIKNEATINKDIDQGALLRRYEKELAYLRKALEERDGGYINPQMVSQLESGKRRVEEDHRAALEALEHTSRAMEEEQSTRRKLEERIQELESMLGGNEGSPLTADEYAMRLDELDRERQMMEEDKAHVDRYKQLLLKQRDIMLNLTTRLNERDEAILQLQEEIDSYDAHIQMLEDAMDANNTSLATRSEAERYLFKLRQRTPDGAVKYRSEGHADHYLMAEEKILELLMVKGRGQQQNGSFSFANSDEKRSMEIMLRDRVEVMSHKISLERFSELRNENENLKNQLLLSENRRRAAEAATSNTDGERIRRIIEQEQAVVKSQYSARLTQAIVEIDQERERRQRLTKEVDRIRFDVGQMKHLLDVSKRAELDRLFTQIEQLEEQLLRVLPSTPSTPLNGTPIGGFKDPHNPYTIQKSNPADIETIKKLETAISNLKQQNSDFANQLHEKEDKLRAATAAAVTTSTTITSPLMSSPSSQMGHDKEREIARLSRSLTTHIKDRRALKTILESRIKVKLDNISELLNNPAEKPRVINEVRALQNLVNASVAAMEGSSEN